MRCRRGRGMLVSPARHLRHTLLHCKNLRYRRPARIVPCHNGTISYRLHLSGANGWRLSSYDAMWYALTTRQSAQAWVTLCIQTNQQQNFWINKITATIFLQTTNILQIAKLG